MDGPDDDAPDFEIVRIVDADGMVFGVGGAEFDVAVVFVAEVEVFDGELVVDESDDDIAVGGFGRAVDDGDVAVVDAGVDHAVAVHAAIEGGFGVADEVAVEVERLVEVVFGRRGEACFDGGSQRQIEFFAEGGWEDVDF